MKSQNSTGAAATGKVVRIGADRKYSVVALERFIQATRDSGYKSTVSAVSELVDNSIQAGAKRINVIVQAQRFEQYPIIVAVHDDGLGMDTDTLRQSLRFGGTTRFDNRSGLGRYGMGLPNASLSQARRVDVYTRRDGGRNLYAYLDVDEIATGNVHEIPKPVISKCPGDVAVEIGQSGTLVVWRNCDRLDKKRVSTIERSVAAALGRIFRHFIWGGVKIEINGQRVEPYDPLFLNTDSKVSGATVFQEPLAFEIDVGSLASGRKLGVVDVVFSELPVRDWHALSNAEKRQIGISNRAGVSVVRAGREIDYGWFFMGQKRRENYDDWWRCEIRFEPELDEMFGITHSKQQIRPSGVLNGVLGPELELIAKALNARVRRKHTQLKSAKLSSQATAHAASRDKHLAPVAPRRAKFDDDLMRDLEATHEGVRTATSPGTMDYQIVAHDLQDSSFFRPVVQRDKVIVVLNRNHAFYKNTYAALQSDTSDAGKALRHTIDTMLLAAARAEAMAGKKSDVETLAEFRSHWGRALDVFMRG